MAVTTPAPSASSEQLAEMLAALASPIRLRLLVVLATYDDLDVGALAAELGIPMANTSHHLVRLRGVGLVRSQRMGTRIVNRVDAQLFDALDQLTTLLQDARDGSAPK